MLAVAAGIEQPREVAKALRLVLSLGVRLLIASSTRSGAVEVPLANASHAVWDGTISTAAELKVALSSITPSDDTFRAAFESARVPNSRLARYYLRSLEMAAQNESEPWLMPTDDGTIINLEHVLPKKTGENWPQFSEDEARFSITRLGNLALMRSSDNGAVGSAGFESKKPFHARSPYVLTSEVAMYEQWTTETITIRQRRLAGLAVKAWPVP